jgi:hypothetical protein
MNAFTLSVPSLMLSVENMRSFGLLDSLNNGLEILLLSMVYWYSLESRAGDKR